MCGIGRSAIYLCPDKICKRRNDGISNYATTTNCQCGGRGFLGTSVCGYGGSCFKKYPEYNQCTNLNYCPYGWACNRIIYFYLYSFKFNLIISKNTKKQHQFLEVIILFFSL